MTDRGCSVERSNFVFPSTQSFLLPDHRHSHWLYLFHHLRDFKMDLKLFLLSYSRSGPMPNNLEKSPMGKINPKTHSFYYVYAVLIHWISFYCHPNSPRRHERLFAICLVYGLSLVHPYYFGCIHC